MTRELVAYITGSEMSGSKSDTVLLQRPVMKLEAFLMLSKAVEHVA